MFWGGLGEAPPKLCTCPGASSQKLLGLPRGCTPKTYQYLASGGRQAAREFWGCQGEALPKTLCLPWGSSQKVWGCLGEAPKNLSIFGSGGYHELLGSKARAGIIRPVGRKS